MAKKLSKRDTCLLFAIELMRKISAAESRAEQVGILASFLYEVETGRQYVRRKSA